MPAALPSILPALSLGPQTLRVSHCSSQWDTLGPAASSSHVPSVWVPLQDLCARCFPTTVLSLVLRASARGSRELCRRPLLGEEARQAQAAKATP